MTHFLWLLVYILFKKKTLIDETTSNYVDKNVDSQKNNNLILHIVVALKI